MKIQLNQTTIDYQMGNIADQKCDAVVNTANSQLFPGGGVCGAIFRAAGDQLLDSCQEIIKSKGAVSVGGSVITPGFDMPSPWIIHTVGPIYTESDAEGCRLLLKKAYSSSLRLANNHHQIKSICLPLISTGIYGYPLEQGALDGLEAVCEYVSDEKPSIELVRFVVFDLNALVSVVESFAQSPYYKPNQ